MQINSMQVIINWGECSGAPSNTYLFIRENLELYKLNIYIHTYILGEHIHHACQMQIELEK